MPATPPVRLEEEKGRTYLAGSRIHHVQGTNSPEQVPIVKQLDDIYPSYRIKKRGSSMSTRDAPVAAGFTQGTVPRTAL